MPVASIALLSSVLAMTYALSQPIIGPLGDSLGKSKVLTTALWITFAAVLASAFAPDYKTLMALRALTGFAAGGLVPIGMAMIGDLFEARFRQVAIARFVMSAIIGQIAGALLAGSLEMLVGWRGVLLVCAAIVFIAAVTATFLLRDAPAPVKTKFTFGIARDKYKVIFSTPRAWVCFASSFIAGCFGFGFLPFIAPILEAQNNGGAREAGFIIGAFGAGALVFGFMLPWLIRLIARPVMMITGSVILCLTLATYAIGLHWSYQIILFGLFGFGFIMQHNPVQVEVSELDPSARTTAYAMHSLSFFSGHAIGPAVYGAEFALLGTQTTLTVNAILLLCAGSLIAGYFLRHHRLSRTRSGTL